jgi:hypothetical protein
MKKQPGNAFKSPIAPLKQSFPSRVNESTNVPKNKALTTQEAANSLTVKEKAGVVKAYLNEWMVTQVYGNDQNKRP